MSETPDSSTSSQPAAAGWYPDPAGSHLQRWWDGAAWTERTYDPVSPSAAPGVYAKTGPDVNLYTPWIWILAVLPVISLVLLFTIDYRQYLLDSIAVQSDPGAIPELPASFGLQLALGAVGWAIYLVSVLLAFLDWRLLKRRGVDRPFHWAWTFLSGLVYLIGRSVVLKRRGRSASAPLWVYAALTIVSCIISIVKISDALSVVIEQLPSLR